jgi:hypothetical protein
MVYAHKVRVIFAIGRRHVVLPWGGHGGTCPTRQLSELRVLLAARRSCATAAGSEALSTPSEASCVAAVLNAPLPMSSRSLVVSPAVPRPSASVCDWLSLCARLCVLRAARGLSTRRLCMSPICSPFPHCCSLAATRPAPPCWEALRRPRFPPLIAGLSKEQLGRQNQPHEGPADAHPT